MGKGASILYPFNNSGLDLKLDIAWDGKFMGQPTYAGACATISVGCVAISALM